MRIPTSFGNQASQQQWALHNEGEKLSSYGMVLVPKLRLLHTVMAPSLLQEAISIRKPATKLTIGRRWQAKRVLTGAAAVVEVCPVTSGLPVLTPALFFSVVVSLVKTHYPPCLCNV
ncbi:hypothetical protein CRENBAI_014587 [Crenichthys baileyi]|uniref:Uncharacterized protein n=1 Tax=Crenichthys baileyi TaxID=28760 RepID=A0AAV9SIS6_9TELE